MKKLLLLSAALLLVLNLSSCKKKGDQFAGGADGDYVSGTPLPDRIEGANFFGGTVKRGQFPPVYFGYDSFTVSDAELMKLEKVASTMKSSGKTLIIAGFTDERGTEEYNRALGEKRAESVRDALISMGLSGGKIQTVSFGEDMPADSGSGEEAWAHNRRAEFGVVQ